MLRDRAALLIGLCCVCQEWEEGKLLNVQFLGAHWVKAFAAKPSDLRLIPRAHVTEQGNKRISYYKSSDLYVHLSMQKKKKKS